SSAPGLGWIGGFQPHFSYWTTFIPEAITEMTPLVTQKIKDVSGVVVSRTPITTPPLDGQVIESTDGNMYVAAGGSLFWFNRSNPGLLNSFMAQMSRWQGNTSVPLMNASDIHAIEVNRNDDTSHHPGNHMPADGTVLLEVGSNTQYMIRAGHPWPIGTPAELDATAGHNQAVRVPTSIGDLQTASPTGWPSGLIQFYGNPKVFTSGGDYVPSVDTRDCLQVTTGQGVNLLPGSARSSFPTTGQTASCDFPDGMFLVGSSGRQLQMRYGAGHLITDPNEVVALGGQDRALPVTETTFNNLLARGYSVPNGRLFQSPFGNTVYQSWTNKMEGIPNPAELHCLETIDNTTVEVVPASFISRLARGPTAICVLPNDKFIYDTSDNQQYVGLYGGAFLVTYDEAVALGSNPAAGMSHDGALFLERQNNLINIPAGLFFRTPVGPGIYVSVGGNKVQGIGDPGTYQCLLAKYGQSGYKAVPQDFFNRLSVMGRIAPGAATCP
ncbi:MAG TPA: hypothetical protein VNX65_00945, partial [Patescibacteria group bacterium]|nr:hypothetical protein [Patescibacteria group bacterium]